MNKTGLPIGQALIVIEHRLEENSRRIRHAKSNKVWKKVRGYCRENWMEIILLTALAFVVSVGVNASGQLWDIQDAAKSGNFSMTPAERHMSELRTSEVLPPQ